MTRMHNPPHPGEILREYLADITVTEAAGISADMAYRLGAAFGTSPELWAGMQLRYDLYQAGKLARPRIERLAA